MDALPENHGRQSPENRNFATKQRNIQLSKVIFWDVDYDRINWAEKARFVIGRVLMYGSVADWQAIKSFYGLERIKEEML